ncbi:peptidoglycan DD-metalloendopeptidase family protein [Desulfohalovibrio reitneri]|uniref:peptidoglycan DD-metalloendopeptidase family protein n=1 Tax=Desulfohalovibrio reitneri TaxID=1307759 RepID=UPI00069144BB|nr:peptidoglycan DD-metalloendopeptidase family protein [Desulfohalovibrio reitneri]
MVRSGDTATKLLGEWFGQAELIQLADKCDDVFSLRRISAGHDYRIECAGESFRKFQYDIDADERLVIEKVDGETKVSREPIPYDVNTVVLRGTIKQSLFQTVSTMDEQPGLAFLLSDMFAWDIDFVRDIRPDDQFSVIVEKRYLEGEFTGYGRVVAAAFTSQGHTHYGFRFEEEDGRESFFDTQGKSLRKAFLKAPLHFSRISSGFTWRRLHPIKKVYRAHPAIDYAAPRGTPVKAVGDGTVSYAGYDNAAGNMVKIRHGSVYKTYYLHLKGFARGIRKGAKVRQGEVIGYVGSTGLSTGPHLDFRMKKYGKYINPANVTTPSATEVDAERMDEFKAMVDQLRPVLDAESGLQAAKDSGSIPTI